MGFHMADTGISASEHMPPNNRKTGELSGHYTLSVGMLCLLHSVSIEQQSKTCLQEIQFALENANEVHDKASGKPFRTITD